MSIDILDLLPCSLLELDAYAEGQEWRETWNELRAHAIADGVISE